VLHDKDLAFLYREYLHDVYSSENLSFYLEVEDYHSCEDLQGLNERFAMIVSKYIDGDSGRQTNFSGQRRTEFNELRPKILEAPLELKRKAFDKLQTEIWENMCVESFPNFLVSEKFKLFKGSRVGWRLWRLLWKDLGASVLLLLCCAQVLVGWGSGNSSGPVIGCFYAWEAGKLKVKRPDEKEVKLGGLHFGNIKVRARKTESIRLIDKFQKKEKATKKAVKALTDVGLPTDLASGHAHTNDST